jgi:hypothetical protein
MSEKRARSTTSSFTFFWVILPGFFVQRATPFGTGVSESDLAELYFPDHLAKLSPAERQVICFIEMGQ